MVESVDRKGSVGKRGMLKDDIHMESAKSLDKYKLIAALLCDIVKSHGSVFNTRSANLTLKKVEKRLRLEGTGFLTKTLPRLGKAFDKALSEQHPLNASDLGLKPYEGAKFPKLFGELFSRVLKPDGSPLSDPCIKCIKDIRQICYLFYKYELPYTDEQERQVLAKFIKTEQDLEDYANSWNHSGSTDSAISSDGGRPSFEALPQAKLIRRARALLWRLFRSFDPYDIQPRHGPGAVSTRQRLWNKYVWTNVSSKITRSYPLDAYFYASVGHVCDRLQELQALCDRHDDLPARVILVPKDSRGPRLISCEPVDYQWIQQGLGRAIVRHVERHKLTKFNVFFTDQVPNQKGALYGSSSGKYATLDLNEASDRVSLDWVQRLFPDTILSFLENCRSSSTVLPDGMVLPLRKFAPMGSCLCFPILALTVWSILTAGAPDADTREGIHVYGDDVIVPTAYADDAMKHLESFGLKINHDKSCTKGFFRESCGVDAFKGIDVTPARLRTVWSSSPSADVYTSWIAYANNLWSRRYYSAYDYIVSLLHAVYGEVPSKDMSLTCPSLEYVPDEMRPKRRRVNRSLQKLQWHVYDVKSPSVHKEIDGWSMLLRYFAENNPAQQSSADIDSVWRPLEDVRSEYSVSSYTRRSTSMLVKRWR